MWNDKTNNVAAELENSTPLISKPTIQHDPEQVPPTSDLL
jgi:hypothetical protein